MSKADLLEATFFVMFLNWILSLSSHRFKNELIYTHEHKLEDVFTNENAC